MVENMRNSYCFLLLYLAAEKGLDQIIARMPSVMEASELSAFSLMMLFL